MFKVEIDTDNVAFFNDAPEYELASILRKIVAKLEAGITSGSALDSNGNRVAQFILAKRRRP